MPRGWESFVPRGSECAYANLKLMGRAITTVYDDALRPVGLRASQLALMWAIVALEPVGLSQLGRTTITDQTTLSRTVDKLRRAGLVSVRQDADDARQRVVRLTAAGRQRYAAAMPLWEAAQMRAAAILPLDALRALARRVRKAARAAD